MLFWATPATGGFTPLPFFATGCRPGELVIVIGFSGGGISMFKSWLDTAINDKSIIVMARTDTGYSKVE